MSVNKLLVRQRLAYIDGQRQELARMRTLPLTEFIEPRNAAAAETFLRRSLEAVFDIGRHILAKTGHGELAQEYKSILPRYGVDPQGAGRQPRGEGRPGRRSWTFRQPVPRKSGLPG